MIGGTRGINAPWEIGANLLTRKLCVSTTAGVLTDDRSDCDFDKLMNGIKWTTCLA